MTETTDESKKVPDMNAHVTQLTASSTQPTPIDARSLISDGITRQIVLDGQVYTLRITRAKKLILTK